MTEETRAEGDVETRPHLSRTGVFALFLVTLVLAVFEPFVLLGVPYLFFVLALPGKRVGSLVAAVAIALWAFAVPGDGLWHVERGWTLLVAGWFVVVTLRWPDVSFTRRALGAMTGALAVAAWFLTLRPGTWSVVDWLVSERIRRGVATALEAMRIVRTEATVPTTLTLTVYEAADIQAHLFPALLALGTLCALAVAWWAYVRFAEGRRDGLGAMKDFRFDDNLVWVFIAGLALLVFGPGSGWSRAGSNVLVFMGALYALRGAAVVRALGGAPSVFTLLLVGIALLFLTPVVLVMALVVGLGDTWLDLRTRASEIAGGSRPNNV